MDKTNKKWIDDLQKLNTEFQKKRPNQQVIKELFAKNGFSYSADPVEQMTKVLMSASSPVAFKKSKKGSHEADL